MNNDFEKRLLLGFFAYSQRDGEFILHSETDSERFEELKDFIRTERKAAYKQALIDLHYELAKIDIVNGETEEEIAGADKAFIKIRDYIKHKALADEKEKE